MCDTANTTSSAALPASAAPSDSSTSSSSSTLGSRESLMKRLRFDHVTIRDMPMELGEHPASEGAPITIGWIPQSTRQVSVEVYELYKEDASPKKESDLKLTVTERASILLRAGYDIEEIVNACEQAQEVNKQRESSIRNQKWESLAQARETASRTLKKLTRSNPAA